MKRIAKMTDAELLTYPYLDNLYPVELNRLREYAAQCGIKKLDELNDDQLQTFAHIAVNGETSIYHLRNWRNT